MKLVTCGFAKAGRSRPQRMNPNLQRGALELRKMRLAGTRELLAAGKLVHG